MSFATNNVDLTEYEYMSKINVNCTEYKGYVKVEVPAEYNTEKNINSYFEGSNTHFIDKGYKITNYYPLNNWYVETVDTKLVGEIEKIYDRNLNTYMLFNGTSTKFTFNNPKTLKVDKIAIHAKDSNIKDINLYTKNGESISFLLRKNNFDYELFFDKSYNINEIDFRIFFDNLLKLSEISFYEKKESQENDYLYFYVNNNCKDEFKFYFGEFGKNYATYNTRANIPVEFNVSIVNNPNTLYNVDFDNDTINNYNDNCLNVANKDQKDINYNKIGDACEDSDGDSIVDAMDNCVNKYNRDQLDNDEDGIGNVCDKEDDRFFEKNIVIVYIFAGLIAAAFIAFSVKIMMKDNKK